MDDCPQGNRGRRGNPADHGRGRGRGNQQHGDRRANGDGQANQARFFRDRRQNRGGAIQERGNRQDNGEGAANQAQNNRDRQRVRDGRGPERAGGENRRIYPISYMELDDICIKLGNQELLPGSVDLIRIVTSLKFKERMNDMWKHEDSTCKVLKVIVKAISHSEFELSTMTHEFINDIMNSKFFESIQDTHIQKLIVFTSLTHRLGSLINNLILLITSIITRKPNVVDKFVHIFALLRMVQGKCRTDFEGELGENMNALQTKMVTKKKTIPAPKEEEAPPDAFREISVVPTTVDVQLIGKPYLRKNIVKGRYDDGEHYLDVQFRLLREDFLEPLRTGVHSYRAVERDRRNNVYVYKKVQIEFPELDKMSGNMVCKVTFAKRNRCRWLRQMIFGSLVVLSKDGFINDFLFGTVHSRDVRQLAEGCVNLFFEHLNLLDHNARYEMIESSAYYEAYHPVLRGLQSFTKGEEIPLHKFLVEMDTSPEVPLYIRNNGDTIDFGVICGDNKYRTERRLNVRLAHQRLTPAEVHLDDSQHSALTMVFRQQLAVVQGPPGTGKTHLGHQIARVLLANQNLWNPQKRSPMLVVCYTNHALDQFLNGILKFMELDKNEVSKSQIPMIRIGSRSKDENLKRFMLNEVKKNSKAGVPKDISARRFEYSSQRRTVMEKMDSQSKNLTALTNEIIEFGSLQRLNQENIVSQNHMTQILQCSSSGAGKLPVFDVFIEWLTRATKPTQQARRDDQVRMDMTVLQQLINANEMPEVLAKNLAYRFKNDIDRVFDYLRVNAGSPDYINLLNAPLDAVRNWPRMADMENLVNLGFPEGDAYDALIMFRGNVELAAAMLFDEFPQNAERREPVQPAAVQDQQDDANSDLDELEEYERGRDIVDFDDDDELFDFPGVRRNDVKAVGIMQAYDALKDMKENDSWTVVGVNLKERKERLERIQAVTKGIMEAQPCTKDYALNVVDVWRLPVRDRWRLYKYWTTELANVYRNQLRRLEGEFSRLTRMLKEINQLVDVELLRSARVLGITTTGAARLQPVLKAIQCPVVIIEEAAEVLEAHIVTALTVKCQHVILIGDHKQLRPNPAVYNLAKNFNLDISLFERLINNKFPYKMLENQHRMRTEISRSLMPHFYKDLRDDPSVFEYKDVIGMMTNFQFINHHWKEKVDQEQRSHMNEYEGEYAVRLAFYLLQQGCKAEQITIFCTYMEQMLFIRKQARASNLLGEKHNVRIEVVDNYQGEESDIIILSLVRSLNPEGKIGFLNVDNRVCVALSRAKQGLYILGNIDFLAEKCDLWSNIKKSLKQANALSNELEIVCQSHGNIQTISTWEDFDKKTADGGCHLPCNLRLDCGHTCLQLCHPTPHDDTRCTQPCSRRCENNHPCKKKCFDDCGKCKIKILVTLVCKHEQMKECWIPTTSVPCKEPCPKKLPCGHLCQNRCSQLCTQTCRTMVSRMLPCGHYANIECFTDPRTVFCSVKVKKQWANCGHLVEVECGVNPEKEDCPKPCGTNLPDCGHLCTGTCGGCRQGRLHVRCDKNCERLLICGHVCKDKCSTVCPPCQMPCETACFHSRCSNVVKSLYENQRCRNMPGDRKTRGRKCGQNCPPCNEICSNACVHTEIRVPCIRPCDDKNHCTVKKRICEKRCIEPCDVEPCNKRCEKLLNCGHQCLGLCGEDCPDICKSCPEGPHHIAFNEASELFFGAEDEDDALFIKLACGHCIESQGMDGWIKILLNGTGEPNSAQAIIQIVCPKCKSPVMKSRRYQRQLNQRIMDIETIKRKIIGGTPDDLDANRTDSRMILETMVINPYVKGPMLPSRYSLKKEKWKHVIGVLRTAMIKPNPKDLTNSMTTKYANLLEFAKKLLDLLQEIEKLKFRPLKYPGTIASAKLFFGDSGVDQQLINEWQALLEYLKAKLVDKSSSALMFEQFSNELKRLERWIKVANVFKDTEFEPSERESVSKLHQLLNGSKPSDDSTLGEFKQLLNGFGLSYEERLQIQRALGGQITTWNRCPNGHLYGIGNCGQAMVEARCPDCNATIGGSHHQLRGDNRVDREMTGMLPHERDPFAVHY